MIHAEQPVVHALIEAIAPGNALDAACGTGRHTKYPVERGHTVIGVDASNEMLARARTDLPHAELRIGDPRALPLETASIDLGVCALALTHCESLGAPIAELAR